MKRYYNVVKLLNYAFFDKHQIEKLTDMTVEIAKAFVNDYGLGNVPGDDDDIHRSRNTVEKCVSDVIDFLTVLIRENILPKIHEDDLYRKVDKYSKSKKRYFRKKVPNFEVLYRGAPILHHNGSLHKIWDGLGKPVLSIDTFAYDTRTRAFDYW